MVNKKSANLVYTTDLGRVRPAPVEQPVPATDGTVRVSRQTKGRKGAGVTLISGLPLAASELKALAAELKKKCGVGGAVKQGVIEIQGDNRKLVEQVLTDKGWAVKLVGG